MTTTIDANPAASLAIDDTNSTDTITVTDGPAENGFQTTQVTTATDTTIFANKMSVTIDGGNNGDNVVLDSPDPAAGMQSLTIQNLGTGGAITGGNPSANSPDIAVATLTLQADAGIGVSRALRTQTGGLAAQASTNGVGNINIANGVAAPMTPAATTADLILRETMGPNTGQLQVYDLGNNALLAGYTLGSVGLSWQALGYGAFAGNPNEADLLMRDSNTGNINYFDIKSSQIVAAGAMGSIGTEWQVLGLGDFSGNPNETDLLMRDTSPNSNNGSIRYFDIQHSQLGAPGSSGLIGNIGPEWQALGFGDFSGNANETDMLMRNANNGNVDVFDIQHNLIVGINPMGTIGAEWQLLGVGDFSGNANESDLIMRDTQNGNIDVFDIQHNQIVSAVSLGTIGTEWQGLGVGDFSGNPGEADLAMRDTQNGAIYAFDIQHNQFVGANSLGSVGTEWQNLGVGSPLIPGSPLV